MLPLPIILLVTNLVNFLPEIALNFTFSLYLCYGSSSDTHQLFQELLKEASGRITLARI
jgi:hypothetical protein